MKWLYLILAIIFEVVGTTAMKCANGFVHFKATLLLGIAYFLSLIFLTLALKYWTIGVAYAIWSGLGTALIVLIGIFYFNENLSAVKIVAIGFIILGVIGLHLTQ